MLKSNDKPHVRPLMRVLARPLESEHVETIHGGLGFNDEVRKGGTVRKTGCQGDVCRDHESD